jgi:hypothetical protein
MKKSESHFYDFGWEMSSRRRFADFARQDCSPHRGLHVRRESLGFVPRSRAVSVPNLYRPIRNFHIAVEGGVLCRYAHMCHSHFQKICSPTVANAQPLVCAYP